MKKVLFIDRDGTILLEPADEQVDSLEKFGFLPGVISALSRIVKETDYELVMVTNQDGLGTSSFPEETFWPSHNKMLQILEGEGIHFKEIFIDRTFPEEKAPTRKPGTALLTKYLAQGIDLNSSFVIGDRLTDVELANNIGCSSIYIGDKRQSNTTFSVADWEEIYRFLKSKPRIACMTRKTKETSISIEVNLDGTGESSISTGIGFFDHLLNQIAKHGGIDLIIDARGDLETDEHHTIEDVGILLGETFFKAMGSKKGIERYGYMLPMDDCLARVSVDFGGRPWIVWKAKFKREKVGEMPTEMFSHFFKSFSVGAKCNLNIKAEGENEHHKIESIFKAFAKTVKMAVAKSASFEIPSSKGSL